MIRIKKFRYNTNYCDNCGRMATIQLFVEKKFDSILYIDLCNKCKNLLFNKIEAFKNENEKENSK